MYKLGGFLLAYLRKLNCDSDTRAPECAGLCLSLFISGELAARCGIKLRSNNLICLREVFFFGVFVLGSFLSQ